MTDKKPLIETRPPEDGLFGIISVRFLTDSQRIFIAKLIEENNLDHGASIKGGDVGAFIYIDDADLYKTILDKIRMSDEYSTNKEENMNEDIFIDETDEDPIEDQHKRGLAISKTVSISMRNVIDAWLSGYASGCSDTLRRGSTDGIVYWYMDCYDLTAFDRDDLKKFLLEEWESDVTIRVIALNPPTSEYTFVGVLD